jgi:drug/metabolite transporter (DMT)-like permease
MTRWWRESDCQAGGITRLLQGWLVWGDVPNPMAWSGIVPMVAAGVFMLRAKRRS